MSNIYQMYRRFNQNVIDMIGNVSILEPVVDESRHVVQARLIREPAILSLSTLRATGAVTAHNINQYKNRLYTMRLEEDFSNNWFWLLIGGFE